jgi:D-alanyl-lipoteichoic acid acyltransferase DltB (MBOAT superfamily)
MTFTTLTFFLFLTVFFSLYWSIRRVWAQNLLIVLGSTLFYGWWDHRFVFLMLGTSLWDYCVGRGLDVVQGRGRKYLLAGSLLVNFGSLGTFKYFNFFADSFSRVAAALGWKVDPITLYVILPVGISFYTFQSVGYTIDVYRRKLPAVRNLIDFLAFVSFFPQLVAGPIERAPHMIPQFKSKRVFEYARAVDGCRLILWGLFKKMVIADGLAPYVNAQYGDWHNSTGPQLALATVCFAYQIYCDFSGYSDIAIGTASLLGFSLMRNFAYPYFSQNVAEFWRRWHISLSTWFRDYLYFPLGGNRVGPIRRSFNVLTTFVTSGLWHGASWNFIAWGWLNGVGVLPAAYATGNKNVLKATDTPGNESALPSLPTVLRIVRTFFIICVTWVFFRAETFRSAIGILRRIAVDASHPAAYRPLMSPTGLPSPVIGLLLILFVAVEWVQRRYQNPLTLRGWPRPARWAVYSGLVWLTLLLGTEQVGTFIYFQF